MLMKKLVGDYFDLRDESLADFASSEIEHLHASSAGGVQAVTAVLGNNSWFWCMKLVAKDPALEQVPSQKGMLLRYFCCRMSIRFPLSTSMRPTTVGLSGRTTTLITSLKPAYLN